MYTFLTRLTQVDSILEVILISNRGEVLFANNAGTEGKIDRWNELIAGLDGAQAADFLFEKGCYYLHDFDIGHVVVGMTNVRVLDRVKTACSQVKGKLASAAVRKKVMVKMLADVEETYKPNLVRALAEFLDDGDRETIARLIGFLRQEGEGDPQEREKLLVALCETLGYCPCSETLEALNEFLIKHRGALPEAVETAARISVQQLMLDMPQNKGTDQGKGKEKPAMEPAAGRISVSPAERNGGRTGDRQRIEELLGQGNKGEAIERILSAIEAAAKNRQFEQAEKLREWLMEIDSMALREVIRAAEIIDQAKRVSISREYQETWRELANVLSEEEFSSLYHAMTPRLYPNEETVVRQGQFSSSLYFVNTGRIQVYAISPDREIPLKVFGVGEILGAANFFDISVWTVGARSLGAELYVLTREKLQRQKEAYPALENKLMDFCTRFPSPNALFSKTGRSRRKHERRKAVGRVTMIVLDEQGRETAIGAKGDILDVSRGGLSFSLRFSKKKNAEALLGRQIKLSMLPDSSNGSVSCNAKIMAVRCCDFIGNDYSLHVQFHQELDPVQLQQVLGKGT